MSFNCSAIFCESKKQPRKNAKPFLDFLNLIFQCRSDVISFPQKFYTIFCNLVSAPARYKSFANFIWCVPLFVHRLHSKHSDYIVAITSIYQVLFTIDSVNESASERDRIGGIRIFLKKLAELFILFPFTQQFFDSQFNKIRIQPFTLSATHVNSLVYQGLVLDLKKTINFPLRVQPRIKANYHLDSLTTSRLFCSIADEQQPQPMRIICKQPEKINK